MKWFWSDTHFSHKNILTLGKGRPFDTVEEMNAALVQNFNNRVAKGDVWYHLGDVSFLREPEDTYAVLDQLNGQGHLIRGNHDRRELDKWSGWQSVQDYKEVTFPVNGEKQTVVMCHYPLVTWNRIGRGSWMLHGHCHGNLIVPNADQIPRLDVGVDCHNFSPISEDQLVAILGKRTGFKPPDHHGNEEDL